MIASASTVIGNLTVAEVETVCVATKPDASPVTVAVTLISVMPADTAVMIRLSLEVEAVAICWSSLMEFPSTTLVVVFGQSKRSDAMRVIVSAAVQRPLSPAPSICASSIASWTSSAVFGSIFGMVASTKLMGPNSWSSPLVPYSSSPDTVAININSSFPMSWSTSTSSVKEPVPFLPAAAPILTGEPRRS